jgi:hypothetical protein
MSVFSGRNEQSSVSCRWRNSAADERPFQGRFMCLNATSPRPSAWAGGSDLSGRAEAEGTSAARANATFVEPERLVLSAQAEGLGPDDMVRISAALKGPFIS